MDLEPALNLVWHQPLNFFHALNDFKPCPIDLDIQDDIQNDIWDDIQSLALNDSNCYSFELDTEVIRLVLSLRDMKVHDCQKYSE